MEVMVEATVLPHEVVEAKVMEGTLEEEDLPPQVRVMEMGELEGDTIIGSLMNSLITWMMLVMSNLFKIT